MPRPCASTLKPELSENELNALRRNLRARRLSGKHLEIGTAAGGTLCEMMLAADHGPPFVTVDPMTYFENQLQAVERNLAQNGIPSTQVDIRQMRSEAAYSAARKAGESFDFVLIDGGHKLYDVALDLRWASLVNAGGIIALHDYSPKLRSVVIGVDHFLNRNSNYRRLEQAGTLLILEKISPDGRRGPRVMSYFTARLIRPLLQLENSVRKLIRKRSKAGNS